jgi:hypothetical protein
VVLVACTVPSAPGPASGADQEWVPPVDGRVVRSFQEPISRFGAGHRGVDLVAATGTPVRAANDGQVSFAGDVAGSLHVVVAHDGGIRTSYSFLARVDVRAGQTVRKGERVGLAGGTGDAHGPGVLHFGVRIGDRYVDPMLLFRPPDLTQMVRLVPADERAAAERATAEEEEEHLAHILVDVPSRPDGPGDCADGIPLVEQLCDLGEDAVGAAGWAADTVAEAFEAGMDLLEKIPALAIELAKGLARRVRQAFEFIRNAAKELADALLETPIGRVVHAVVGAGRYFIESLGACDDNAPPAEGRGGSGNIMFAVGGIDSHRERGHRRSFNLPADRLGYERNERYWFSYDARSQHYQKSDTHRDLRKSAALLAQQLQQAGREEPGRTFDLLGHSQGGVVIDVFLRDHYRGREGDYPPIENVVTFASPHEGTPPATAGDRLQRNPLGRGLIDLVGVTRDELGVSFPPPDATAVRQLSEDSPLIQGIKDFRVPEGIHFTSIGAVDDPVVFADHTELDGAENIRIDVGGLDSHSAITSHPRSLMIARAALEHRQLPCTSYDEKITGAIQPALASAVLEALSASAA